MRGICTTLWGISTTIWGISTAIWGVSTALDGAQYGHTAAGVQRHKEPSLCIILQRVAAKGLGH